MIIVGIGAPWSTLTDRSDSGIKAAWSEWCSDLWPHNAPRGELIFWEVSVLVYGLGRTVVNNVAATETEESSVN